MKVFLSADMEGTAGVTAWSETEHDKPDYPQFQALMTAEVVAACEGALAAGATEIIVKDAHHTGRNLLVDPQRRLYLIDCPTGAFWHGPFLQRRIVKDLACLDKVAKYQLSRTQRLRFYLQYCQRSRLIEKDKPRIRQILNYFQGRE